MGWKEVEQAQKEKRCELVFSGTLYSERISKEGLDPSIFSLTHLNFLEVSKASLSDLPAAVGKLVNLTRLVVCHNDLTKLPSEIGSLKKLKMLDVSHNKIEEFSPVLSELKEMQSLNVSSNKLSALPDAGGMLKLVTLNISHNQFTSLPASVCDSSFIHFTDLIAGSNEIAELPPEIGVLGLKVLDLSENKLSSVPGELGNCSKLKELNLKGNNLKDKRLLKLVEQCHVKQVLEYIRSHCNKSDTGSNQNKSKKKSKQNKKIEVDVVTAALDELKIFHVSDESMKVIITSPVADVRPYIVCCKVLNVDLSEEGILKKFITLQTKLHENICEKRTAATIATHDMSKIQGDLLYDARPPDKILVTPLNRHKEMTAADLYAQLSDEADAIRKEKKKNTYSGIHKYLYLLKDKPLYPCLIDKGSNSVISFPPITNSEGSKISPATKEMLLEVTGNNLNVCKKVLDALILEILKLGLGSTTDPERKTLTVQQIKVVDEEGVLKVVYPSRTDIQSEEITILRT